MNDILSLHQLKNIQQHIDSSFSEENRTHLTIQSIPEDIISKEHMDLWVSSLLQDDKTHNLILKRPTDHKKKKSKPTEKTTLNETQAYEVNALKNWIIEKNKERSYSLDEEDIEFDKKTNDRYQKLKAITNTFDEHILALNNILKFALSDAWDYFFNQYYWISKKRKIWTKVYVANEYDDIMTKTDFIWEVDYGTKINSYCAYDLTLAENNKEDEYKTWWPSQVFCKDFDLCKITSPLKKKMRMPRSVLEIKTHDALSYLTKYLDKLIQNNWHISKEEVYEIIKSIDWFRIKWKEYKKTNTIKEKKSEELLAAIS